VWKSSHGLPDSGGPGRTSVEVHSWTPGGGGPVRDLRSGDPVMDLLRQC